MNHFQPFIPRKVMLLPTVETAGWHLKRYAVLSKDKTYDSNSDTAALSSAIERLPVAGNLEDSNKNHGIGFQIVHFAEVAVVSPIFYWMWGSVLANTDQIRAQWDNSNTFETGVKEIIGCVWEMQIVNFETKAWTETMLGERGTINDKLDRYLKYTYPDIEV